MWSIGNVGTRAVTSKHNSTPPANMASVWHFPYGKPWLSSQSDEPHTLARAHTLTRSISPI